MASGSFLVTSSNGYIDGTLSWSSTPNTAGNYSDVTASLRMRRNNSEYTGTTVSTGTFTINIDGSPNTSASTQITLSYNSNTLVHTATKRVTHNSDGKKSISIAVSASHSRFSISTQSKTITLDTIPRASSLSAFANFTVGNTITASISRASSSFTHTLMLYVGSTKIGEWTGLTTSLSVTPTAAQLNALYGAISTSATVTMRCYTYSGTTAIGSYTTRNATATIANASTISTFGNFTIGNNVSVALSRAYTTFTHTIMLYAGNVKICERTGIGASTTLVLTAAEQDKLYLEFKSVVSGSVTLRCYTYHGGNLVRSYSSKSATASVSSSITPTVTSITVYDSNSASRGMGIYVQGVSHLSFTVNGASGAKSSLILTTRVTFNGVVYSGNYINVGVVNRSGSLDATVVVTDSRGRTDTASVTVAILAYSVPKIATMSVIRSNSDKTPNPLGTHLWVKGSGEITLLSNKNTLAYYLEISPRGANVWSLVDSKSASVVEDFAIDKVLSDYSIMNGFDVRLRVQDKFNTTLSLLLVKTGEVTMSWSKDGIGVGKIIERGALDVDGDIYRNGIKIGGVLSDAYETPSDLNDAIQFGAYRIAEWNSHLNMPPDMGYGQMLVVRGGGDSIVQIGFNRADEPRVWVRVGNPPEVGGDGAYGAWRELQFK